MWFRLADHYKTDGCWMEAFPWNPSQPEDIESFFILMTFERYSRAGRVKERKNVELENLFDPVKKGALCPIRVLVRGDPGMGKTTMCRKLCCDWSMGLTTVRGLPNRKTLPVLYSLRQLPPKGNLEKELLNFIRKFKFPGTGGVNQIKNTLKLGNNVVFILDGYDEVNDSCAEQVRQILIEPKEPVFRQTSFLVTSRYTEEWEFLKLFEKHFYIDKLSEKKVTDLVKKFYRENAEDREAFFLEHPARSLTDLPPLVIFMLCWITKEQKSTVFVSKEDIIGDFIFHLAERCNEREKLGLDRQKINDLLIQLGFSFYVSSDFIAVSADILRKFLQSDYEFPNRLGILREVKDHRGNVLFEPLHKLLWDHLEDRFMKHFENSLNEFPNANDAVEKVSAYVRHLGFSGLFCVIDVTEEKVQKHYLEFYEPISPGESGIFIFQIKEGSLRLSKNYDLIINQQLVMYFSSWNASMMRELTNCVAPNAENTDEIEVMIRVTEKMPEIKGQYKKRLTIIPPDCQFYDMYYKLLHWLQSKTSADDTCLTKANFLVILRENKKECLDKIVETYVHFREDISSSRPSRSHGLTDSDVQFQKNLILSELQVEGFRFGHGWENINVNDPGITCNYSEFDQLYVTVHFPIEE